MTIQQLDLIWTIFTVLLIVGTTVFIKTIIKDEIKLRDMDKEHEILKK